MSNRGITVIDVCRKLGVEPSPSLTWAVGAAVRDFYEARYGCLPEKDLRTKTSGGGSHCFAIYPENMESKIAEFIWRENWERERQGDLFG